MSDIELLGRRGRRIKTLKALERAVIDRRAVIVPGWHTWEKPRPAAIVFNLPCSVVLRMLNRGMYVYNRPNKK